jgi:pyrroloquinoline quinone (PQQ) biosynthesis protein C
MQQQLVLLPEELQALLVPAAVHMVTQHLEAWQQQAAAVGLDLSQGLSDAQLEQVEAALWPPGAE